MPGQIILAVAGVIAAATAATFVAGSIARVRLRRASRAPGRLVDIGGYRLHLDVRGPDVLDPDVPHPGALDPAAPAVPTIVLEGGTWAPAATWGPLQDVLARDARVVAYDRAGLGWSDPSPRPRTARVMADELRALLRAAAVPGPYLLVGHSFGGLVVRAFAAAHPGQVAGVVLLDGAHEAQFERFPAPLREMNARMTRLMPVIFGVVRLLGRAGILALRPGVIPADMGPLPEDVVAGVRARIAAEPRILDTMARELGDLPAGNAGIRAGGGTPLGALPLVVLSHGRLEGLPPGLGPDVADTYEATWQELQAEQAALSTRGRHRVVEGAGHNIHAEAPGAVLAAVREVIAAARPAEAAAAEPTLAVEEAAATGQAA